MKKVKKLIGMVLLGMIFSLSVIPCLGMSAETSERSNTPRAAEETVEPKSWGVNIMLYIEGENGVIRAWAKNIFTLFPAVVRLDVELYSSDTYQSTYTEMELEKRASTPDLDQGHTLEVSVPTNGE